MKPLSLLPSSQLTQSSLRNWSNSGTLNHRSRDFSIDRSLDLVLTVPMARVSTHLAAVMAAMVLLASVASAARVLQQDPNSATFHESKYKGTYPKPTLPSFTLPTCPPSPNATTNSPTYSYTPSPPPPAYGYTPSPPPPSSTTSPPPPSNTTSPPSPSYTPSRPPPSSPPPPVYKSPPPPAGGY